MTASEPSNKPGNVISTIVANQHNSPDVRCGRDIVDIFNGAMRRRRPERLKRTQLPRPWCRINLNIIHAADSTQLSSSRPSRQRWRQWFRRI
ncbi:hypothetical protein PgNI_06123 [Pyricularia grisea]|uniref:Uncharacterized protein n=1 Tax=Pyricularia grisea TaxID=148305 RepID=A0A6P8B5H0_PYRGI|nr:hypothetical protein PgNI_06123 [Pyricularia grisea]TLD10586.1 hypothetical protein PgNI_06123 [Pyricularia grisea]